MSSEREAIESALAALSSASDYLSALKEYRVATAPFSIRALLAAHDAEVEGLKTLASTLRQEAQIHAMESRSANATIAEIYQLVTGATGEPGNWNGAEPVRAYIAKRDAETAALRAQITDDAMRTLVVYGELQNALERVAELERDAARFRLCEGHQSVRLTMTGPVNADGTMCPLCATSRVEAIAQGAKP